MLGTQIISKGLDFPNVSLVGVIDADTSLNDADFRSNERCFQLLTQVVGRGGRGNKQGYALIQTTHPNIYPIVLAAKQDYTSFFTKEMEYRKELLYPPYRYMASICFANANKDLCYKFALKIKEYILASCKDKSVVVLGPSEPNLAYLNKKHHFKLILK